MSEAGTDEVSDVAESGQTTAEQALYPTNPPKRKHKKQKKKKKKCKTMRKICWRIPKIIFITGIALLIIFSLKRLSEDKEEGDGTTDLPIDGAAPNDDKSFNENKNGGNPPLDAQQDEEYPDDNEDPALEETAKKESNKDSVRKEPMESKEKEQKPGDKGDKGDSVRHAKYRMKRGAGEKERIGKEFKFKDREKGVAEIVAREIEPEDEATAPHAVIVTGVYHSIMNDVLQLIASVQKYLPYTKIVVFQIDLEDSYKEQLRVLCNVELRPFWANVFPEHVSDLDSQFWRPFVIQMALAEFHFIAWMDPHTRLINSWIEPALRLAKSSGVSAVASISRSSPLSLTHPDMLQFIPTDEAKLDALPHMSINMLVLHNNDDLQDNLMKWLLLCAAEKECLGPDGASRDCKTSNLARNRSDLLCHKYEESAINILLANWFQFDMRRFYVKDSITEPTSETDSAKDLQKCPHKGQKRDL